MKMVAQLSQVPSKHRSERRNDRIYETRWVGGGGGGREKREGRENEKRKVKKEE